MKKLVALVVVVAGVVAAALGGSTLAGAQGPTELTPAQRPAPTSVSLRVTPGVERRFPWRFVARGRVNLPQNPPGLVCPPGRTAAEAPYYCIPVPRERLCDGARVAIRYKTGKRLAVTISLRRVRARLGGTQARPFCRFRSAITFRAPQRIRRDGRLKVQARFLGNKYFKAKSARNRFVRVRGRGRG